jgi:hypothetical protein
MTLQRLRGDLMHGVIDVPEPQIGFGQRRMQRLGGSHRNQALFVSASKENGNAHQFRSADCRFIFKETPLRIALIEPVENDPLRLLDPNPLDFPVQLYSGMLFHPGTDGLAQRLDIVSAGVAGIDQEIAVHL